MESFEQYIAKAMIVEKMNRPFLNMYAVNKDNSEMMTNIVFITHPFTRY